MCLYKSINNKSIIKETLAYKVIFVSDCGASFTGSYCEIPIEANKWMVASCREVESRKTMGFYSFATKKGAVVYESGLGTWPTYVLHISHGANSIKGSSKIVKVKIRKILEAGIIRGHKCYRYKELFVPGKNL
jgi:hypothetical protein